MSAIEEVLWNIFTYYSLNGNPKDPSKLHSMGLLKLCKDIMALDQTMTESPITQADLHLIYTSVLRSPSKSRDAMVDKSDKLNFDEFLSCISRIAQKCYSSAVNQEEAMQQLLMDNILPMAHRRIPTSIAATVLREPGIEHLLKYYESSLTSIFKYFAVVSDQLTKDRNMVRATQHIVDTFDDQIQQIQKANVRCVQQNSISKLMSYIDFLKFSSDLGLISSLSITIVEFGDIFLTVTSFTNFSTSLRRIDFSEFCEALVRIALRAFEHLTHVSNEDKVKALFMNMWRHSQEMLGQHMLNYGTLHGGGFISSREELLRSVEAFSVKFKTAWAREGYCNYLEHGSDSSNTSTGGGSYSPKKTPGTSARAGGSRSIPNTPGAGGSRSISNTPGAGGNRSIPSTPAAVTATSPLKGGASLLKRLKASYSTASAEKQKGSADHHTADIPDTMSVRSGVTGRTGTLAETIAEIRSNKEKLLNTLHERTEDSESFVVTTADGGQFRVMLSDTDSLAEGKVVPGDLRRLLLFKPELAAVLYDTMVEEGIVRVEEEEGMYGGDDDGLEELGITMDDLALVQDTVGTATASTPTATTGGITSAADGTVDAEAVQDSEDCS